MGARERCLNDGGSAPDTCKRALLTGDLGSSDPPRDERLARLQDDAAFLLGRRGACPRYEVPMDSTHRRDAECLFCQIIDGIRPAEVIHSSAAAVAFLDRFPAARGHTLVVPRDHAATLPQLEQGRAAGLLASVAEVVELLTDALHPVGFNVGWNHGAGAGQHVFHLHLHVMPRFTGGGAGIQAVGEGAPNVPLADIAAAIRRGGDSFDRPRTSEAPGANAPRPR